MYTNYYPQQQTPYRTQNTYQQQLQYNLKGRPVSSLDEVRATTIDFDGSVFFFPDLANKRIYTKQIGMDGSALFNMYELKEMPTTEQINNNMGNYITREEFESAINQIKSALPQIPSTNESTEYNF